MHNKSISFNIEGRPPGTGPQKHGTDLLGTNSLSWLQSNMKNSLIRVIVHDTINFIFFSMNFFFH